MNQKKRVAAAKARRIARVRAKIHGTLERPRLSVCRSLAHIYAQIIDDTSGRTLAAASDLDMKQKKGQKKMECALAVGKLLAERAKAHGISAVIFDRRDKRYHGRVKTLADGAREGGLQF